MQGFDWFDVGCDSYCSHVMVASGRMGIIYFVMDESAGCDRRVGSAFGGEARAFVHGPHIQIKNTKRPDAKMGGSLDETTYLRCIIMDELLAQLL